MKKTIVFTVTICFLILNCNNSKSKLNKDLSQNDSVNKPQTKISVHKEYDNYGNLISIDSSYSYFYSNIKNDSLLEKEVFDKFKLDFDTNLKSLDSIFLNDFFIDEPFKLNHFYTDEFFQNNFKLYQEQLNNMFKRMDSIKNNYYKKQFPDKK